VAEQLAVKHVRYTKTMPDKRKYADRAEYLKKAVSKRRKKVRQMAVEYLGASARSAAIKNAGVHSTFIILTHQKKSLEYLKMD